MKATLRKEAIGTKYDENKLAHAIAKRFVKFGWGEYNDRLKRAWKIVKFEEEMDFFEYCWVFHNQADLHGDDEYAIRCAEGDNPYSWVDNEIDKWNDYTKALEKGDVRKLINFMWDAKTSLL